MMKIILTGAGAIALASTAALADPQETTMDAPKYQAAPAAPEAIMSPIDVATRKDVDTLVETQFAIADDNADGSIDKAEFDAFVLSTAKKDASSPFGGPPLDRAPTSEKAFAEIAKADGKISKQELVEARVKSFEAADGNRDKTLDALEQQKFASLVAVKPSSEAPRD